MTRFDEIEARRLQEQEVLDSRKTFAERNRLGQFATPPNLALDIARYARSLWKGRADSIRFLDPGSGTGSFYSALRRVFPADAIELAAGIEVDPDFAETAAALWDKTGFKVMTADF